MNLRTKSIHGTPESIPLEEGEYDLVCENSVMENVHKDEPRDDRDLENTVPVGIFSFFAASGMSLWQNEIRGFPLFDWYPGRRKYRIIQWAKYHSPRRMGFPGHLAVDSSPIRKNVDCCMPVR